VNETKQKVHAMVKVLKVGTVPEGDSRATLWCKVTITDGGLSISGVVGPMRNGNARGGCGQIDMGFAHRDPKDDDARYSAPTKPDAIHFADGWSADLWLDFLDTWKRWHLNHMRSACEHQRAFGWTFETHPSAPCPTCGYKLGHAWLREELPESVIEFLHALPAASDQPAWC